MPRKNYSTEQIVTKLRQAEIELGRGLRTLQVCKKLGVSEGIVKLRLTALPSAQYRGFTTASSPVSWGSVS